MSSSNDINKIIKANYKNIENLDGQNNLINDINYKDSESSFNQLLSLQLLIQKHSGLKELCKNFYSSFIIFNNYSYK